MSRRALLLLLLSLAALIAAGAAGASPAGSSLAERHGSRRVMDSAVSSNWAGYVATAPATSQPETATGLTFTDVAGTWIQPRMTCSVREVGSAAFWVGLGGSQESSAGLEQIGTEGDCDRNGNATYAAWYEFLPAASVPIKLQVRPGDRMLGAVLVNGAKVTITLKNLTSHKRFSRTFGSVSPLDTSSAEWIAEAPSLCTSGGRCSVVPLPNFGTTVFTNGTAIANSHAGTISDPTWSATPVVLAPDQTAQPGFGLELNQHGAIPSSLSEDGRSFTVAWQETVGLGG